MSESKLSEEAKKRANQLIDNWASILGDNQSKQNLKTLKIMLSLELQSFVMDTLTLLQKKIKNER